MGQSTVAPYLLFIFIKVIFSLHISKEDESNYDKNFIQNIWQEVKNTEGIYQKIINTPFNSGIMSGKLDPIVFAGFIVQDFAYETSSVELWQKACFDGRNDPQFFQSCSTQKYIEKQLLDQMNGQIRLENPKLNKQTQDYINYKNKAYKQNTYHYIAIVNYVCLRLYIDIGLQMMVNTQKENPYYWWINLNGDQKAVKDVTDYQIFTNKFQHYFDREIVKKDLQQVLHLQLSFFRALQK